VSYDLIFTESQKLVSKRDNGLHWAVRYLAAVHATNMVVRVDVTIEPFLGPAGGQPLNHTAVGEDFQVAIDGPQADVRQSSPSHLIDLVGGRM